MAYTKEEAAKVTEHTRLVSLGVDSDEAWFRLEGFTDEEAATRAVALKRKIARMAKRNRR